MDFIGNLIAGAYKAFLLALMQPTIWIHDGKPFFAYYFGIGAILTIMGISARVMYERSNGANESALKLIMISKYTLLLMAVYLAASVPFMFGMA